MFLDPKYNMSCNGPRKMELWGWKRFKRIENDEFTKTPKLGHSSLKSLTVTKPQNCTAYIISSKSFLECYTNSHLVVFLQPSACPWFWRSSLHRTRSIYRYEDNGFYGAFPNLWCWWWGSWGKIQKTRNFFAEKGSQATNTETTGWGTKAVSGG